jgi:omega-6 fatty acid desaturase (delta-12 desaturase)
MIVTSIIGVWLFAVQHRFDDALWARQREWHFAKAALEGSSYLKLPRLLQWFTGNIGFHNVHHFAPRIPNYRLEHCYRAIRNSNRGRANVARRSRPSGWRCGTKTAIGW